MSAKAEALRLAADHLAAAQACLNNACHALVGTGRLGTAQLQDRVLKIERSCHLLRHLLEGKALDEAEVPR